MPAPIAFNTGSQTAGTLKVAGLEYSISSSIGSGSANLRWFPTVNPGPYGLVFATSNFTQSYGTYQASTLLFYTASDTVNGIISASNRLPDRYNQTQFATTASALEWIASSGKYFMMNYEYPQIVSNKLEVLLDAGFLASYPRSSTTWYNVQGKGDRYSTMVNSPTYSSTYFDCTNAGLFSGGATTEGFQFNTNPGVPQTDSFTFEALVYPYTLPGQTSILSNSGGAEGYRWGFSGGYMYWLIGPDEYNEGSVGNNTITTNSWLHLVGVFDRQNQLGEGIRLYCFQNGQSTGDVGIGANPNMSLAAPGIAKNPCCAAFDGRIANLKIYSKALTQTEILQNYYQSPIVTNGLILAYDSSNLVSYPGSSTTWYDMSGNGNHGTISSGEFVPSSFGGYLRNANNESNFFYITIPNSTSLSNTLSVTTGGWTIEEIIWTNSTNYPEADAGSVFSNPAYGPGATGFDWNHGYGIDQFQFGQSSNSATGYEDTVVVSSIPSQYAQFNTWRIRTMIWDRSNNTVSLYINGVYIGGGSTPNTAGQAIYDGDGGSIGTLYGWKFYGRRGAFKIWNKILSPSEIVQNFNAQRNRFGL